MGPREDLLIYEAELMGGICGSFQRCMRVFLVILLSRSGAQSCFISCGLYLAIYIWWVKYGRHKGLWLLNLGTENTVTFTLISRWSFDLGEACSCHVLRLSSSPMERPWVAGSFLPTALSVGHHESNSSIPVKLSYDCSFGWHFDCNPERPWAGSIS